MSHRLPPLNGLRAFEAAARHLSFVRAADELGVTPGAVSQQVKSLESSLGTALFRRLPRGLILTIAGEGYLPAISAAFEMISRATEDAAPALRGRKLRLGVAPTIARAAASTVRRLNRPPTPKDAVILKITDDLAELLDGRLDAMLRATAASHPGLHIERLELVGTGETQTQAVLLTLPGLAGCRQHRRLLRRLKETA